MNLQDTKTYENIKKAFAFESQAIVRYMFYSEIAKKNGKNKAAELFDLMAKNEFNHAKVWFSLLGDSLLQSTNTHLKEAAFAENSEWQLIYPECAKIAHKEGLEEIAELFERISSIEADHERRFIELFISEETNGSQQEDFELKKQTELKEKAKYYCMFCGFPSDEQSETCPFCHSESSFILA